MNPMKDSGVEWIGEIPRDWKISKIKYTTKLNGRIGWQGLTSNEYQDEGPFLITGTDFKDGRINFDSAVHIAESRWAEAKQIQVENGDLLITKDGTVGKVAIIEDLDGKASLNSGVLRIQTTDELNRKYLYYVLLSEEFWLWFNYTNSGASTILHLYQNVFERFTYAVPPLQEQQAIADFLDEETKKLDDAKDLLQKQIEKLKEYRKSLIWETVTKGLDKSVPMKDSGVEWIGEIPKQWDIAPLITVAKENKIKNARMKCNNLLSLSYGNIIRKNIYTNFGLLPESFEGYQIVHEGYLILRMTDLQNDKHSLRTGYVTETGIITSAYIGLIPCKTINNKYLSYLLHSYDLIKIYYNLGTGVRQSLTFNEIKKLPVLLPLKEEQQAIADFLDEKTTIIEKIISNIQSQIEVIDKQKKTLIYDYVTGKRRVI